MIEVPGHKPDSRDYPEPEFCSQPQAEPDPVPKHHCEFLTDPERGRCEGHEMFAAGIEYAEKLFAERAQPQATVKETDDELAWKIAKRYGDAEPDDKNAVNVKRHPLLRRLLERAQPQAEPDIRAFVESLELPDDAYEMPVSAEPLWDWQQVCAFAVKAIEQWRKR